MEAVVLAGICFWVSAMINWDSLYPLTYLSLQYWEQWFALGLHFFVISKKSY